MSERSKSYSSILRSSSIIGGAQLIVIIVGMVRVKFVAVLLGPLGIGVMGILNSVLTLAKTISDLGLRQSAVKSIASSIGNNQQEKVAEIVGSLKLLCLLLGLIGMTILALLSPVISNHFFEGEQSWWMIVLLSVCVLMATVTGGRMAVIQGFRRIKDLAVLQILGTVLGSVIAVVFYYLMGVDGIIPALISLAFLQLLWAWVFSRRIEILPIRMSWDVLLRQAKGMLGLGLAMMWNGLVLALTALVIRSLLVKELDITSVGIYCAAFSLSGYVVNFVLQAMRADYYPQLSSLNEDHYAMRELVNNQMEVGLLMSLLPILGMMGMSPLIIHIFYSGEFEEASALLQWFLLGCFGRVASWPIGFIMLAKGNAKLFALVQTVFGLAHVCFVFWGIRCCGVLGASIAFAALYVLTSVVVYLVGRQLIGFKFRVEAQRLLSITFSLVVICFAAVNYLPYHWALLIVVPLFLVSFIFDVRAISRRLGDQHRIVRFLACFPGVRSII